MDGLGPLGNMQNNGGKNGVVVCTSVTRGRHCVGGMGNGERVEERRGFELLCLRINYLFKVEK